MWLEILQKQRGPSPPRLSVEDATILYEDADFNLLRSVAMERRRFMNPGNHVTYMIDRNVNYTNVCTINCQFCSLFTVRQVTRKHTLKPMNKFPTVLLNSKRSMVSEF